MKKLKKPMKPKPSKKVKKARKPNPPKRPKKRAPPKPKTKTPAQPAVPITADGFPALAEFFRGYFHEDMADDYGSMVGAAEQFCLDADHIQIEKLYRDWLRFTANTCKMDLDGLNSTAINLGSDCLFRGRDNLMKIEGVLLRSLDND